MEFSSSEPTRKFKSQATGILDLARTPREIGAQLLIEGSSPGFPTLPPPTMFSNSGTASFDRDRQSTVASAGTTVMGHFFFGLRIAAGVRT